MVPAERTIEVSARLKTGQCGILIQSTTSPRKKKGARNNLSVKFPNIPPKSNPIEAAHGKEVSDFIKIKIPAIATIERIEKRRLT